MAFLFFGGSIQERILSLLRRGLMRIYSTVESFAEGEVTWLAIIETLLATAIGVAVVILFETYLFMAIGAGLAPLLLLRTKGSVDVGFKVWARLIRPLAKINNRVMSSKSVMLKPLSLLLAPVFTINSLLARFFGITIAVCSQPITTTLNAIPHNWHLQVLCLDLGHPPELVPGMEKMANVPLDNSPSDTIITGTTFSQVVSIAWRINPSFLLLVWLWFFPAWIYRWSLKSTAWAYCPLLFIILRSFSTSLSVGQRFKEIRTSEIARVARVFSLIFIALFLAKLIAFHVWADWSKVLADWGFQPFFFLIEPTIVPRWQVVFFLNAALGWCLFFFAGRQLETLELTGNPPASWVDPVLRGIVFVRTSLAVGYIIPITLFLLAGQASNWNFPALGEKWVPWDWVALWISLRGFFGR